MEEENVEKELCVWRKYMHGGYMSDNQAGRQASYLPSR
jgi:hypothetical protein